MNFHLSRESEFLSKADDIILENLWNESFDVSEMARKIGMSRTTLHRKFKSSAGIPTSRYIRQIKLNAAMDMLKQSSANITEIALECGFSSIAYFVSCFKEQYGTSPNKIRKDFLNSVNSEKEISKAQDKEHSFHNTIESKDNLHNFPSQLTSFIGRVKEMEIIKGLLKSHRIITLVGSGGCGKTRLACEVVGELAHEYKDGIWFIDLAPLEKGDLVVKEIMDTMQIPEYPGEDMIVTLLGRIRDMELLLILDNCEHLANTCAEVAGKLAHSVNGIKIIATSRVVLNIKGEKVWRIPSLSLVEPGKVKTVEQVSESEAVQLFTDRAQMNDRRFILLDENINEVATICKRVDGIPLALELTASHTRYMEPGTLLERLSDKFSELVSPDPGTIERHKTLNSTIDWSYMLLSKEEKTLFKRLSVFSGSFDLTAIEEVCKDATLPGDYILDLLSSLVDRSMVNTIRNPGQPMRYYLLETLRQYASGLFSEKEERRIRRKHLNYFISMADAAYADRLVSQAFWMGKLHLEHDNFLSALNWSEQFNRTKFIWLAGALSWFWSRTNNLILTREIQERILESGNAQKEAKARLLAGYAWTQIAHYKQFDRIVKIFKQSLTIWHKLKNRNEEALVLADMSFVTYGLGDDEGGMNLARESYDLARIENDPGVILYSMMPVSQGFVNMKNFAEARAMAKKIIESAEELENLFAQFMGHHHTADCALMEGKFREAEKEYATGVKITRQYGDMHYIFTDLTGMAMAIAGLGRYKKALRLIGAIREAATKARLMAPEDMLMKFWHEQVVIHIHGSREKLGEELTKKYETEGKAMDLDETIKYALDFEKD